MMHACPLSYICSGSGLRPNLIFFLCLQCRRDHYQRLSPTLYHLSVCLSAFKHVHAFIYRRPCFEKFLDLLSIPLSKSRKTCPAVAVKGNTLALASVFHFFSAASFHVYGILCVGECEAAGTDYAGGIWGEGEKERGWEWELGDVFSSM